MLAQSCASSPIGLLFIFDYHEKYVISVEEVSVMNMYMEKSVSKGDPQNIHLYTQSNLLCKLRTGDQ